MNTSNLDNRVLSLFVAGMLALFGSMAFEAQRNGMTDPVVAVRQAPLAVVAATGPAVNATALAGQNGQGALR